MNWLLFVVGAVLSWGMYGSLLHRGQVALGSPTKALLCVGVAYFLIGVLGPVVMLGAQGQLGGFNTNGTATALIAGALGAIGALCIILSHYRAGGSPLIVMPLVFGGAPLRQRAGHDAAAPAAHGALAAALPRLPARGRRRVHGALLQAPVVGVVAGARATRPSEAAGCAMPAYSR